MNRQAAHFSVTAFNMTRYKRGASLGLAAPDGVEDGDVFVIRNVDAVAVDEVEPPHHADTIGDALHGVGQFFVAGGADERVMERFVERGDLAAIADTSGQWHVPHALKLVEHLQDDAG